MAQPYALLIDDNRGNLEVLAGMLTLEGVACLEVNHPDKLDEALKKVTHLDVIFLDLEMPGKDGYAVLDRLRKDARFKDVPIVAYTVHVSEINVARQKGFHSFLGKPLDADRFPEQLTRILRGERVWTTV